MSPEAGLENETEMTPGVAPKLPVRVRIDLAYLGTHFHGWQIQRDQRTVQGELQHMLTTLLSRDTCPIGAGRTDSGVHARGQVCHVSLQDDNEVARLSRALPHLASVDMEIVTVRKVSPDFNARFSALTRRYSYHFGMRRDIFQHHTSYFVMKPLDRTAMDSAAAQFLETHDFTSFCKASSRKEGGSICTVDLCHFQWAEDSGIFHVRANRFLHHMVRNMVGTLFEIGIGLRSPEEIPAVLAARERKRAGRMAPALGLFLEEVVYPQELMDPGYRQPTAPSEAAADSKAEGDTA